MYALARALQPEQVSGEACTQSIMAQAALLHCGGDSACSRGCMGALIDKTSTSPPVKHGGS